MNEFFIKPSVVKKGWGSEIVISNSEKYCGKVLCFDKDTKFSMHFHMEKDETWYVSEGSFLLRYIDTENADNNEIIIRKGDAIHISPGQPHQLEVLDDSGGVIFEVSTKHVDSDSYRIFKGDSQKDKI